MPTALQKITTRAKQIRKAKPKMTWGECVQAASAEYRKGSIAGARKKAAKKAPAKKRVGAVMAKAPIKSLGSVVSNISNAKKIVTNRISSLTGRQAAAKTKPEKKKIAKEIAAERVKLRKLSNI